MMRVLVIAMLIAGTVHADRETANMLAMQAARDHDPATYDACGKAFIELYGSDPAAVGSDETLFDAAICFTRARSLGAAVQALQQLIAAHPSSKFGGWALFELGQIAEVTGHLDDAAQRYEELAKRYAGDQNAIGALANAVVYRLSLGDDAGAIADARYFARTYGAKQPTVTAGLMLQLVPTYERRGGAVAFVEGLVKNYATALDASQLAIATAKLAELKWDATCKGRALCVTEVPRDKLPRCSDRGRLRVDKRTATADAEASLARAAKLYEQRKPDTASARHAYAMTKVRIADRALEAYLAVGFPSGLDFSEKTKAASTERFSHWITDRTKLGAIAQKLYEEVIAIRDPDASVAATARLGQLSSSFATTLRTAEIPADIRRGEFAKDLTAAFCEKLTEVAEPLAARALQGFEVCRAKSIEFGIDSAWTELCRREASALDPKLVVDEPQLGPLVPIYPQPWYEAAPHPAKQDPPAYAAAWQAAEKDACPKLAAQATDAGRYLAALVAARCGRTDEARRGWAALSDPAALASLGSLAWNRGDGPAAIDAWTRARKLDGRLAVPLYGLALARFGDASHDKDVELDLVSATIAAPQATEPKIMLALFELHRNRPLVAQLYLAQIGKVTPALLVARAVLRARDGDWAQAAGPLVEADQGHWAQAGYDLALLAIRRHDYAGAAARLGNVKPGYDALVARGAASAGLGKHAEAIADYRAAIALDAARPEAHFDLGLVLAAQASFHEAAGELDLAKATALADRYRKL